MVHHSLAIGEVVSDGGRGDRGRLLGDDQWTWFALFSVGILLLGLVINIMTDLGEASPEDRFPEDMTGVLDHAWSEDEALILRSTPDGNDLLRMPTSGPLVTVQLPGATSIAPSASGWWVTTSTQVHHLDRGSAQPELIHSMAGTIAGVESDGQGGILLIHTEDGSLIRSFDRDRLGDAVAPIDEVRLTHAIRHSDGWLLAGSGTSGERTGTPPQPLYDLVELHHLGDGRTSAVTIHIERGAWVAGLHSVSDGSGTVAVTTGSALHLEDEGLEVIQLGQGGDVSVQDVDGDIWVLSSGSPTVLRITSTSQGLALESTTLKEPLVATTSMSTRGMLAAASPLEGDITVFNLEERGDPISPMRLPTGTHGTLLSLEGILFLAFLAVGVAMTGRFFASAMMKSNRSRTRR